MKVTNGNGKNEYQCPFCLKRFNSAEQMARHLVYSKCRRSKGKTSKKKR